MKTFDFSSGTGLIGVQQHANQNGWHLIRAKWVSYNTDNAHWRVYYVEGGG
jgi:hypothetical protein